MFRYRLRTLLLLTLFGPPLLAALLLYGDRPYHDFVRWLNRRQTTNVRVITIIAPTHRQPDEGDPNPR